MSLVRIQSGAFENRNYSVLIALLLNSYIESYILVLEWDIYKREVCMSSKKGFKEKMRDVFGDFRGVRWKDLNHKRVFIAAAALLLIIALFAFLIVQALSGGSGKKQEQDLQDQVQQEETTDVPEEPEDENPLEVDAYANVNEVVEKYFTGLSAGDIPLVEDVVDVLTDEEAKAIATKKEYVESYNNIVCYTKKGLEEGTYVVFASYEMKILNIDTPAPGMMPLYVGTWDDGSLYIFNGDAPKELEDYVLELVAEEELAGIIADVQTRYETALTEDPALAEFDAKIHESQLQPTEETPEEPTEETPEQPTEKMPEEPTEKTPAEPSGEDFAEPYKTTVTATIRIRAERSADSEMIDTLASGTGVKVYAHYSDGWSKIEYNGETGYCKTEYLKSQEGGAAESNEASGETQTVNKTMELTAAVRIRAERSADSSKVANAYKSELVKVVESYGDGWSKVIYNGKTGYCQTKYLKNV